MGRKARLVNGFRPMVQLVMAAFLGVGRLRNSGQDLQVQVCLSGEQSPDDQVHRTPPTCPGDLHKTLHVWAATTARSYGLRADIVLLPWLVRAIFMDPNGYTFLLFPEHPFSI